jgi:hypothetical protein
VRRKNKAASRRRPSRPPNKAALRRRTQPAARPRPRVSGTLLPRPGAREESLRSQGLFSGLRASSLRPEAFFARSVWRVRRAHSRRPQQWPHAASWLQRRHCCRVTAAATAAASWFQPNANPLQAAAGRRIKRAASREPGARETMGVSFDRRARPL